MAIFRVLCVIFVVACHGALVCHSQTLGQSTGSQLTSSLLPEVKQRALFDTATTTFLLDFNNVPVRSRHPNLQQP